MKTALVTGASGGIGNEIVKNFCQKEIFVGAQYNKNSQSLISLKEQLAKKNIGDYLSLYKADFCCASGAENLYKEFIKDFNHTDILVCNAGIDLYKLAQDTTNEEFNKVFMVNTQSAFILSKLCLEQMIKRKSGKIIFVSSVWEQVGASNESVYSLTKSALIGYTKALAKEVGSCGITVNCVCPGFINTPMNNRFTEQEKQEIISRTPLLRAGTPSDVANLISFLTSKESDFITGQVISCDGGFIL